MTSKIRNLITRTVTGIVFTAILIASLLYSPLSFGVVFMIITALSVWEFCTVVNQKEEITINPLISTVAGAYLFMAVFGYCFRIVPSSVFIPYLVSVIYLFISELYLKRTSPLNNWAFTMLGQMYVALPFALLSVLAFITNANTGQVMYNGMIPLSVFIFLWANDTGAYCFGSLLGKRKLFPSISPNKSWEGSIGGGAFALAISQLLASNETLTRLEWFGLALVVVLFGTWGDLVESLLKRQLNIKDSGTILPGHGGMLDRFDSALLAIPAAVIYLYTITLF